MGTKNTTIINAFKTNLTMYYFKWNKLIQESSWNFHQKQIDKLIRKREKLSKKFTKIRKEYENTTPWETKWVLAYQNDLRYKELHKEASWINWTIMLLMRICK